MPTIHHLTRDQVIDTDLETAWEFIKSPANLDKITPSDMNFEIVSDLPKEMHEGLLIEYRIGIPILGKQPWLTEIKHIRNKHSFVDEQRAGPYKLWLHYHEIQECANGVRFHDHVIYIPPFGIIGNLANTFYIKNELKSVFDFRESAMKQLLTKPSA